MENEHELSYETLTRVYLGSYEHYKGVEAEVEHPDTGFELQGAKMVEMGHDPRIIWSRERLVTWVIEGEGRVRVGMKHVRSYLYLNSCKEAKELLRPGHGHV
ncbi:hypothetical protein Tco_1548421 [Tanacetum coccineum]